MSLLRQCWLKQILRFVMSEKVKNIWEQTYKINICIEIYSH